MPRMEWPEDLGYGKLIGRFAYMDGDDGDLDTEPNITAVSEGTVTVTPSVRAVRYSGTDGPIMLAARTTVGLIDEQGYLCTVADDGKSVGGRGVVLPATDSTQLSPTDFTYQVEIKVPGVSFRSFNIQVPSDSEQDIGLIAPVPSSGGTATVVDSSTAQRAEAAAEEAETIKGEVEDALANVPTVAGLKSAVAEDISTPGTDLQTALHAQIDGRASGVLSTAPRTPYPKAPRTTWVSTFQPGHGAFDNFTGQVPGVADTEDYLMGAQSLRVTGGSGLTSVRLVGLDIDLTDRALVVYTKAHSLPGNLTVYAGTADLAQYLTWTIDGDPEGVRHSRHGEWFKHVLPVEAGWGSPIPDLTAIETVMVRTMTEGPSDWSIQAIGHQPVSTRWPNGYCAITFDDGHGSLLDAARQVLTPRGLAATNFVIPEGVGTWGGYLDEEGTAELYRVHGWDLQAHGSTDYATVTAQAMREEWTATKNWFVERGYPTPDHLAWPYGSYDFEADRVAQEFFTTARTIDLGIEAWPPARPTRVKGITGIGSAPGGVPVSSVNGYINDAREGGHAVVLVFHQITQGAPTEATGASIADLAAVVDHALASGIEIGTYADMWK